MLKAKKYIILFYLCDRLQVYTWLCSILVACLLIIALFSSLKIEYIFHILPQFVSSAWLLLHWLMYLFVFQFQFFLLKAVQFWAGNSGQKSKKNIFWRILFVTQKNIEKVSRGKIVMHQDITLSISPLLTIIYKYFAKVRCFFCD